MRIYSVGPRDGVQRLDMDIDWRVAILRTMGHGATWTDHWQPPKTWRLEKPRKRGPEELCDWTAIGAAEGIPALSGVAKALVEQVLGGKAQWLPLAFDEREYFLLNCLHLPDVLDTSASSMTLRRDGSVSAIDQYAFKPSAVAGEMLFKVSGAPNSIFVTDRFRSLAEGQGLTGLFYQPVWDSEHAPFKPIPDRREITKRPEIYGPEGFVLNVQELWPSEWKDRARQMKRDTAKAVKGTS